VATILSVSVLFGTGQASAEEQNITTGFVIDLHIEGQVTGSQPILYSSTLHRDSSGYRELSIALEKLLSTATAVFFLSSKEGCKLDREFYYFDRNFRRQKDVPKKM
jgi:hypothetical protein